jgi:UDP-3-O-[3-hydroxymyristoyl] N-acetylglucosamine deacetylase/3-hydroxyacyl-[acyl-carrier-protein] dehydratase
MILKTVSQKTIGKPVFLKGVGLHTGSQVKLSFLPAPENTGFIFIRSDIKGKNQISADVNFVVNTDRGTNIERNGIKIQTSEHVLAALVGLDIDNCYIEINASEPPIMDGSSKFFIEALEKAGIKEQESLREEYVVNETINFKDEDTGSEITVIPSDEYQITTMVDFGTKVLGTQNASLESISSFKDQISSARTFSFLHELEALLEHGLIKGGDLNNAIVYVDTPPSKSTMEKLKKAFKKDKLRVKPNGILDNLTLHYSNEAARHKLLDVIGDLALVGTRIRGRVIANKPGHKVNTSFGKILQDIIKSEKRTNAPYLDLNQKPLLNTVEIMKILPHRPPFLLVDKVFELSDTHVVALKKCYNE